MNRDVFLSFLAALYCVGRGWIQPQGVRFAAGASCTPASNIPPSSL